MASSEIQALPTHKVPYPPKVLPDPGDLELTAARDAAESSLPPPHKEQLSLSVGAAQVLPITAPLNTSLLL